MTNAPTTPQATAQRITRTIATEIGATPAQVAAAVGLLDGGATVPFIARYRKEVTGGLDDTQLRTLSDRLTYLRELEARRRRLASIDHRAGQDDRRSGAAPSPGPAPRPSWKISICPTSPSAAPRR
jgi:transcriptional accessory protein Tex/SPT6